MAPGPAPSSSEMVAALAGCGIALFEERRRRRRRRADLALHELRRPLQALLLGAAASAEELSAVDLALAALRDLESALGDRARRDSRADSVPPIGWARLVEDAAERWGQAAWLRGGSIAAECRVEASRLGGEQALALSAALDNLLHNALIHGGPEIAISAEQRHAEVELAVVDRGDPPVCSAGRPRPGGGHGLRAVNEIAARLGGEFRLERVDGCCRAVIRIPTTAAA